MEESNKYIYKGVIHIHTKLSDGTGNLKTVVKAAKKNNLDWIIITDHNHYDTEEGIIDGVYVIKGEEISPYNVNHYLALGINNNIQPDDNPQVYIDKVREQGGFGFAAHPDEGTIIDKDGRQIPRKNSNHCIIWSDKKIKPDGVEIWNWFSNWADNFDDSSIFKIAYAYLFEHSIIKNPSKITLTWWDKLNNETEKIVPAIGGVDAHALKYYRYIIPVTVFPYNTCLGTVTNYIHLNKDLSKDFYTAKNQILDALKYGNNIIANLHICKKIPQIYISNSDKKYYCGENVKLSKNCCLHFHSDKVMETCLVYNGGELIKYSSDNFIHQLTKGGKYRLEVYYKGKGFLYTNPFIVEE